MIVMGETYNINTEDLSGMLNTKRLKFLKNTRTNSNAHYKIAENFGSFPTGNNVSCRWVCKILTKNNFSHPTEEFTECSIRHTRCINCSESSYEVRIGNDNISEDFHFEDTTIPILYTQLIPKNKLPQLTIHEDDLNTTDIHVLFNQREICTVARSCGEEVLLNKYTEWLVVVPLYPAYALYVPDIDKTLKNIKI